MRVRGLNIMIQSKVVWRFYQYGLLIFAIGLLLSHLDDINIYEIFAISAGFTFIEKISEKLFAWVATKNKLVGKIVSFLVKITIVSVWVYLMTNYYSWETSIVASTFMFPSIYDDLKKMINYRQ
jgi:hypothetical protein